MSTPAVRVEGLRVRFGATASLDGVDLVLAPDERVHVTGPSGGGKSTLLHVVTGVVPQALRAEVTGTVEVLGEDPRTRPVARGAARIGWLGQDPASNACLPTVLDEVALPLENRGVPRELIGGRVARALDAVGALHLAGRRTSRLSGGEQQRVALAAVLAGEPEVLLLDEPTSMLDPVAAVQVLRLLEEATRGRCAVLVAHGLGRRGWAPERSLTLPGPGPAGPGRPGARRTVRARRAVRGTGEVVLGLRRGVVVQGGAEVVRGVDLDLRAGEVTCVVGTNGSGKSSLLLGLAGLLPGTTPDAAGQVALVFQRAEHQFVTRPAAAEVGGDLDLLDRLGLGRVAGVDPFRLSGGQQRRLAVGAMLALGRRVLALDEPTSGLDDEQADALVELVVEQAEAGAAVVLATHDLDLAARLADQVLVLDSGSVAARGGPELLADDELMVEVGLALPVATAVASTEGRTPATDGRASTGDRRPPTAEVRWSA